MCKLYRVKKRWPPFWNLILECDLSVFFQLFGRVLRPEGRKTRTKSWKKTSERECQKTHEFTLFFNWFLIHWLKYTIKTYFLPIVQMDLIKKNDEECLLSVFINFQPLSDPFRDKCIFNFPVFVDGKVKKNVRFQRLFFLLEF